MVVAFYQKIASREYLATLLGKPLAPYTGFNASVNPATSLWFSVAAFRYGHAEVGDSINRFDEQGNEVAAGPVSVRTCIYRPQFSVYDAGTGDVPGLEAMLYGLAYSLQGDITVQMADALRYTTTPLHTTRHATRAMTPASPRFCAVCAVNCRYSDRTQ
jgi:hypothetical protein